MATLRCEHPDIIAFIETKRDPGRLSHFNLPVQVTDAFMRAIERGEIRIEITAIAVRLLDNVIDASRFPLAQQREAVHTACRIGLGVMGLADALIMLGIRYDSDAARDFASATMRTICRTAYRQSVALAEEKGCFPAFEHELFLAAPFIQGLPDDIRNEIAHFGVRNSHLLAIAPTGAISLLAGNVSSGIEPVFAADLDRTVLNAAGESQCCRMTDHAIRLWREQSSRTHGAPEALTTALELPISAHLAMQSAIQASVDNVISKTINIPAATEFSDFSTIYRLAYEEGSKGCTTFRSIKDRDGVLAAVPPTNCSCQ